MCLINDSQVIYLDPEFCLPNRIVSVNMTNTPFRSHLWMQSYTFYNCSLQKDQSFNFSDANVPFPCLSNGNSSVIAVETDPWIRVHMPSSCKVMTTIDVPVGFNSDFGSQLEMIWFTPFCRSCESEGKACRLKSDDNSDGQTICVSRGKGIQLQYIFFCTRYCLLSYSWHRSLKSQNRMLWNQFTLIEF